MGDSDSLNRHISSTPEGERKRVKSNEREIAKWFDDRYEQDMKQHHARDILTQNFIKAHSEDFDDKGSDRWVYTGNGPDSHVEQDNEDTNETDADDGKDTDDKLTFSLTDGPTDGGSQ